MINEIVFNEITIVVIKVFMMNNIQNTLSFLSFNQIVQAPITTKNSISILYFILRKDYLFSRSSKIVVNFMWHNQTKWIKVFNHLFINISVTYPMCTGSFNTIQINYSTFFLLYVIRKSISGVNTSEIFNSQIIDPFFEIKIGKWFIYKMVPRIGMLLNGLFFPNNNPWPFFLPFPVLFFPLPVFFPMPIVSPQFP